MKPLFLLGLIIGLTGCSYTQIYETRPTSTIAVDNQNRYVFENDTLKVMYNFWADKGQLQFDIFNKLDMPIYIDWKKCSFIQNGQKIDYWIDKTTTQMSTVGVSFYRYNWWGNNRASISSATSIKPERVTFIAPKSSIDRNFVRLYPVVNKLGNDAKEEDFKPTTAYSKKEKSTYINFTPTTSPLVFRNFLTFGMTEDVATPFYVDNGFYITKVSQTKLLNVFRTEDENDIIKNPDKQYVYNPTWFYVLFK